MDPAQKNIYLKRTSASLRYQPRETCSDKVTCKFGMPILKWGRELTYLV